MRLLNTSTLSLKEFVGHQLPDYAILSHTWSKDEILFADVEGSSDSWKKKSSYEKVQGFCDTAADNGYQWVWIDTCCIDKSSSSELSEAINSMYAWYASSHICYVYLEDYDSPSNFDIDVDQLHLCRWFKRGWTLQELIAPRYVEFFDGTWKPFGTKQGLAKILSSITGVNINVLKGAPPSTCCVAERMSWASRRKTTRLEDEAYCLLGIFEIHMPLLYGEGRRAFLRLQEEILKVVEDFSLLAWTDDFKGQTGVLSRSPAAFSTLFQSKYEFLQTKSQYDWLDYARLRPMLIGEGARYITLSNSGVRHPFPSTPPEMTSRGLRLSLPVFVKNPEEIHVPLYCLLGNYMLCLKLHRLSIEQDVFIRIGESLCRVSPGEKLNCSDMSIYCLVRIDNKIPIIPELDISPYIRVIFRVNSASYRHTTGRLLLGDILGIILSHESSTFRIIFGIKDEWPRCLIVRERQEEAGKVDLRRYTLDLFERGSDQLRAVGKSDGIAISVTAKRRSPGWLSIQNRYADDAGEQFLHHSSSQYSLDITVTDIYGHHKNASIVYICWTRYQSS